jgi:hypothetical protein
MGDRMPRDVRPPVLWRGMGDAGEAQSFTFVAVGFARVSSAVPASAETVAAWLPTVQLRHVLPDGSWHIDWMMAVDAARARPLVTFRLPRPVHELGAGESLAIERIGDHRPAYLEYEGDIGGGRGVVRRIAQGEARRSILDDHTWLVQVRWRRCPEHVAGVAQASRRCADLHRRDAGATAKLDSCQQLRLREHDAGRWSVEAMGGGSASHRAAISAVGVSTFAVPSFPP